MGIFPGSKTKAARQKPPDCFQFRMSGLDYAAEPLFILWEQTDSNRRPSACKADALNQLSYAPLCKPARKVLFGDCKDTAKLRPYKFFGTFSPPARFSGRPFETFSQIFQYICSPTDLTRPPAHVWGCSGFDSIDAGR
jgi:hypothetical protein